MHKKLMELNFMELLGLWLVHIHISEWLFFCSVAMLFHVPYTLGQMFSYVQEEVRHNEMRVEVVQAKGFIMYV